MCALNITNETFQSVQKNIALPVQALERFCTRWSIVEFSVFGSVLGKDFRTESDVDVLITFAPDAQVTLFDMVEIETELTALFGRNVDVLTRGGVEMMRNPVRRRGILDSARVLYGTR